MIETRFGSGAAVRRVEDAALVRGEGRFTDDVQPAGQLVMRFVRSTAAHAKLVSVDVSAAKGMPGVVAVYTGADLAAAGVKPSGIPPAFPRRGGKMMEGPPHPPLAVGTVRFVGEAVAAIVATSKSAAQAAADAVTVEYEDLPVVTDPAAAVAPGAPVLWEPVADNVAAEMVHGSAEKVDAAFAAAAHVVKLDIVNQRLAPSPMEPRSVLAQVEDGRLVVRLSSQTPTGVRTGLVEALPGVTEKDVRVLVGDVGGGFGMKTGFYAEDVAVAWAALQLQRPVKWQAERLEDFLAAVHGRDLQSQAEMALDANGKVLGLRIRSLANVGAYPTIAGIAIQVLIGPWVTTSIYDIQAIDLRISAVLTNTAPTGPYRGAGRPEAIYTIERLFDSAARKMGMDPAELRRRNMIRPEQFPYTNSMAQVYDVGIFEKILDQGLALSDWKGFDARRAQSKAKGKLRGRGIATFLEWTGANVLEESVTVNVTGDGYIELTSATQAMGQGIATSYVQLAHDVFGVPLDKIRVLQGDTDRANGFGSAGSRSLFTGGAAVQSASQNTVDQGKALAAEALEAPAADIEYKAGRYTVAGTDLGIGLFELAAKQQGGRIVASGDAKAGAPSWPNGCHICEVEIDPATGQVDVVAYASVNDIGRIVSPTIVRGQVEGGAVQGIGQALCERVAYDPDSGQLMTGSFMDYALPHADGFTGFKTQFDQSAPCKTNRLGAKGVGELGTIGATPAVVNAVVDALASTGLGAKAEAIQMPLTGETVWRMLHGA